MSWVDEFADDVLFPSAAEVDRTGVLPSPHLDALAAAGLYGVQGPAELGGIGSGAPYQHIVEALASGCLATTFVWLQHHGAVRAVAAGPQTLREQWLAPLCSGRVRAAVAQAAVRPGPASVRAVRVPGGYVIDGEAPWVTGWGLVDVCHVAAREEDDTVVWALVDAVAGPTLTVRPLDLVAVNASRTVLVRFERHVVAEERVTATVPLAEWSTRDAAGLRTNGSLSLGAVRRCIRLLEPFAPEPAAALAAELDAVRDRLDVAAAHPTGGGEMSPAPEGGWPSGNRGDTPPVRGDGMPAARAAASELALRAAATLAVAAGARGVLAGEHAQRLLREAAFLLVFGSRPGIRAELLRLVSRR